MEKMNSLPLVLYKKWMLLGHIIETLVTNIIKPDRASSLFTNLLVGDVLECIWFSIIACSLCESSDILIVGGDSEYLLRNKTDIVITILVIVKASSGPRYVVGCRNKVDKDKLTASTRVVLDMKTLTIMRVVPREVDPVVYYMLHEDPGNVSYSVVGGLSDQIRELREYIPLMNPELFLRVGIKPPKVMLLMVNFYTVPWFLFSTMGFLLQGVLLYGPPGM